MARPWGVVWGVWGAGEFGAGGVCSGSVVGERRRVRSAVAGWFGGAVSGFLNVVAWHELWVFIWCSVSFDCCAHWYSCEI